LQISRRRRDEALLCSCRRRNGPDNLPDGWACESDSVVPACALSFVRRRRRYDDMCACRRRSTTSDLPLGYTCGGTGRIEKLPGVEIPPSEQHVTVMSYNVLSSSFSISWSRRRSSGSCKLKSNCYRNDWCQQDKEIAKWHPDVVGTQELGPDSCADMLSLKVGPSFRRATGGESILYNSNTVEMISGTEGHERLRYCDSWSCRSFSWAKFRMTQDKNFVFWHFNVHMTHEFCDGKGQDRCTTYVPAGDGQARSCWVNECRYGCKCNKKGFQGLVAKRMYAKYRELSSCEEPVVITGDWNPHKDMLEDRMPWSGGVNTAEEVLVQRGFTMLEKPGRQQDGDICKYCDRVFYTTLDFDVVEDSTGKRAGSDHTPHIVRLKPKRQVECNGALPPRIETPLPTKLLTPSPSNVPTLAPVGCSPAPPAPALVTPTCESIDVSRRRRQGNMCTCRRRWGSAHLPNGWTCGTTGRIEQSTRVVSQAPDQGTCQPANIRRRRRNVNMCSCRRRDSSNDLPDGWTCEPHR
jgi:hypothetical protein